MFGSFSVKSVFFVLLQVQLAGFLLMGLSGCVLLSKDNWRQRQEVESFLGEAHTDAINIYLDSEELLSAGRQKDAEEILQEAECADFADEMLILFARGVLERSRGNKTAATKFFRECADLYLDDRMSQAGLLAVKIDQNKDEASLRQLLDISKENPDESYILWLSAIECWELGQGQKARKQFDMLFKEFPMGPVMAHHIYAELLDDGFHQHEEALMHRYLALSMEANSTTLEGLAKTLGYLEKYEQACVVWEQILDISPYPMDYYMKVGHAYRMAEKYREAFRYYAFCLKNNPTDQDALYWMGYCASWRGEETNAVYFYRRAADLGDPRAMYELTHCYRGIGALEENPSLCRKAASQDYLPAIRDLAVMYRDGLGVEADPCEAFRLFSQYAEQQTAEGFLYMGNCYWFGLCVETNLSEAVRWFQEGLEKFPDHAGLHVRYAKLLATCGDPEFENFSKAVLHAERAVELNASWLNLDVLAVAYEKNAQFSDAVHAQERLIGAYGIAPSEEMLSRLDRYRQKAKAQLNEEK